MSSKLGEAADGIPIDDLSADGLVRHEGSTHTMLDFCHLWTAGIHHRFAFSASYSIFGSPGQSPILQKVPYDEK